jgi:hypothetical protein
MANAMLAALHALGLDDVEQFGDSTAALDLSVVGESSGRGQRF